MFKYSESISITRVVDHDVISITKHMMFGILRHGLRKALIKTQNKVGPSTGPCKVSSSSLCFHFCVLETNQMIFDRLTEKKCRGHPSYIDFS